MSIFGSTFKPFVIRQLNTRQALLADGIGTVNRNRNVQLYTGSKTAWCKMSSFVNYSADEKVEPNDSLAKKYVLMAGTLLPSEDSTKPNNRSMRFGVQNAHGSYGADFGGTLEHNRQLGIRPMPGIESVNVTNKGAYGSLRQATIKFHCWDKKQLDDLEILYMRVGYPVLLEWGWSMYMDTSIDTDSDYKAKANTGDLKTSVTTVNSFIKRDIKSFTEPTIDAFTKGKDLNDLYDDIMKLNHKLSGNYDGMVGIIQNFTWELLPNGSFACTTILISMGDALDSIKMNRPTKNHDDDDLTTKQFKTGFTEMMQNLITKRGPDGEAIFTSDKIPVVENVPGLAKVGFYLKKYGNVVKTSGDMETYTTYIQLAYFIALINKEFNLLQNGKPLVEIELPIYNMPGNKGNGLCLGSVDSVSVNPFVCLVHNPKATWVTGTENGFDSGVSSTEKFLIDDESSDVLNLGQIGNIYLNVQYLRESFNSEISSNNYSEVHIYTYLKKILVDVSKSLGSINSFNIFTIDSKAVIMDENYTELPSKSKKDTKFELNIFGTNSVTRGLKATSKIFQSQINMIAIAAGSNLNLGGVNSSTQSFFNKGLHNRLYKKLTLGERISEIESERQSKLAAAERVLELRSYLQNFLKGNFPNPGESIASAGTLLNSVLLNVNSDVNFRAIIPIDIEVVLDGIAGIAIGEIFTINTDMLPEEYRKKNLGFIVKTLQHNISNKSDWTTTIETWIAPLNQEGKSGEANSLTKKEKEEFKELFEQVKTNTLSRNKEYYTHYLKLIYFIKAYFENELIGSIDRKIIYGASNDQTGDVETTLVDKLGPITIPNKAEFGHILLDADSANSDGKRIIDRYNFKNFSNDEIRDKKFHLLNPLLKDSPRNKDIKKLIHDLVNKSSDYKILTEHNVDKLVKDINKIISDVFDSWEPTITYSNRFLSGIDVVGGNRIRFITPIVPLYPSVNSVNEIHYERDKAGGLNPEIIIKYTGEPK